MTGRAPTANDVPTSRESRALRSTTDVYPKQAMHGSHGATLYLQHSFVCGGRSRRTNQKGYLPLLPHQPRPPPPASRPALRAPPRAALGRRMHARIREYTKRAPDASIRLHSAQVLTSQGVTGAFFKNFT